MVSRYRFSLNPKIKGYIEWQIEHYHEDKKQLEDIKKDLMPSIVQGYSLAGGIQSGTISKPTEKAAINVATNPYILATERSIRAIDKVLGGCDETDIKLIELVYWRRTHTVEGAAMVLNYSARSAYRHINKMLYRIALEMGYVNI